MHAESWLDHQASTNKPQRDCQPLWPPGPFADQHDLTQGVAVDCDFDQCVVSGEQARPRDQENRAHQGRLTASLKQWRCVRATYHSRNCTGVKRAAFSRGRIAS